LKIKGLLENKARTSYSLDFLLSVSPIPIWSKKMKKKFGKRMSHTVKDCILFVLVFFLQPHEYRPLKKMLLGLLIVSHCLLSSVNKLYHFINYPFNSLAYSHRTLGPRILPFLNLLKRFHQQPKINLDGRPSLHESPIFFGVKET
jgi:hypothetical protein